MIFLIFNQLVHSRVEQFHQHLFRLKYMNNKKIGHLLRSTQAAEWMGMSLSTFYSKVKRGELPRPTYRAPNSVAWDSTELEAAKISTQTIDSNDTEKKMFMTAKIQQTTPIKTFAENIEWQVLQDLLDGRRLTHASIWEYAMPGMNVTMQHVIASLRSNWHVIIKHSRKEGGYWYISQKDAAQYRRYPRTHRLRKERIAIERSIERRNNTISNLCINHRGDVLAFLMAQQA